MIRVDSAQPSQDCPPLSKNGLIAGVICESCLQSRLLHVMWYSSLSAGRVFIRINKIYNSFVPPLKRARRLHGVLQYIYTAGVTLSLCWGHRLGISGLDHIIHSRHQGFVWLQRNVHTGSRQSIHHQFFVFSDTLGFRMFYVIE